MTTGSISSTAAAAREQARDTSGRFGTQPAAESDVDLDGPGDWRDAPLLVRGRRFTMGQVRGGRLYHGTPSRLDVGDELRPGAAAPVNTPSGELDTVSVTSDPALAALWARRGAEAAGLDPDQSLVLEVQPSADVQAWRVMPADGGRSFDLLEARASTARVVGVRTVEQA